MAKYLDQFKSLIPSLQGDSVVRLVESLRTEGEIITEDEYWNTVNTLLGELSYTEFKPLYRFRPFSEGISSSEHFNDLLSSAIEDIKALVKESENISKVVVSHRELFYSKIIPEFEDSFRKIDTALNSLNTISNSQNSFEKIFFNNFKATTDMINEKDEYFSYVMFDTRLNKTITLEEFGSFNRIEPGITFSPQSDQIEKIREVEIGNGTSISEYPISNVGLDIYDIIRPETDQIWSFVIVKKELLEKARLVIRLKFNDYRLINYIFINRSSDFPIYLESFKFINYNSKTEELNSNYNFSPFELKDNNKKYFNYISTREVELTFTQKNFVNFAYDLTRRENSFDDLKLTKPEDITLKNVASFIADEVVDEAVLDSIKTTEDVISEYENVYKYQFGFREISLGTTYYNILSYFVSSPYSIDAAVAIALEVDQFIPDSEQSSINYTMPTGMIEYELVKQDFSGEGAVISTLVCPILPIGTEKITSEFQDYSIDRICSLRFLAHTKPASVGVNGDTSLAKITLYRNAQPLTHGVDWAFYDRSIPGDTYDTQIDLSKSPANETRIELLSPVTNFLIASGTFLASYIPTYIYAPFETYLIDPYSSYLPSSTLTWTLDRPKVSVAKVHVYLKITLRNFIYSPKNVVRLNYYKLLVSTKDLSRYQDI